MVNTIDWPRKVYPSGRYQHYKGPVYLVLAVARHSETGEYMVVYCQEYGQNIYHSCDEIWVRPKDMFLGDTVVVDGEIVPRFKYIGWCGESEQRGGQ